MLQKKLLMSDMIKFCSKRCIIAARPIFVGLELIKDQGNSLEDKKEDSETICIRYMSRPPFLPDSWATLKFDFDKEILQMDSDFLIMSLYANFLYRIQGFFE